MVPEAGSLRFFRNYFSDCMQYTSLRHSNFEVIPIDFSIVQGSTLGLLMFLVNMNDLVRSSLILKFNLYADDTCFCLSGNNLNTLIENPNGELSKVSIWFRATRLTVNSSKSLYIVFHSRQPVIPVNMHNIVIGEEVIA